MGMFFYLGVQCFFEEIGIWLESESVVVFVDEGDDDGDEGEIVEGENLLLEFEG